MNWFQVVSLPLIVVLLAGSIKQIVRGGRARRAGAAGAVLWLTAAVAIHQPDFTTRVAGLLGIGRGADLLIYVVAILFLAACFYFYQRLQHIESALTEIVRNMAIQEALQRGQAGGGDVNQPEESAL